MPYIDGFLLPVPKKPIKTHVRMARRCGKIWREHGALEFRECAGDDLKHKGVVSFFKLVKAKPNETTFFSWIVYQSRARRDRVNAKMIKDPRLLKMTQNKSMPLDPAPMAYGGFQVLVDG